MMIEGQRSKIQLLEVKPDFINWARARFGLVLIDLDGTILKHVPGLKYLGKPMEGALDVIAAIRRRGFRVVVHTSRPDNQAQWISAHLAEHGIEVDGVNTPGNQPWQTVKPLADLIIDDKGYRFRNWQKDGPTILYLLDRLDVIVGPEYLAKQID